MQIDEVRIDMNVPISAINHQNNSMKVFVVHRFVLVYNRPAARGQLEKTFSPNFIIGKHSVCLQYLTDHDRKHQRKKGNRKPDSGLSLRSMEVCSSSPPTAM